MTKRSQQTSSCPKVTYPFRQNCNQAEFEKGTNLTLFHTSLRAFLTSFAPVVAGTVNVSGQDVEIKKVTVKPNDGGMGGGRGGMRGGMRGGHGGGWGGGGYGGGWDQGYGGGYG